MQQDDLSADRFFEQLSRREADGEPTDIHIGAVALRDALLAEAHVLREAKNSKLHDISAEEQAWMQVLRQRLTAEGAIGRPHPLAGDEKGRAALANPQPMRFGHWLRSKLLGDSWVRPLGLAASLVLVSFVVLRAGLRDGPEPHESDSEVRRSGMVDGQAAVISAIDPATRASQIAAQLRAAGADVVVTPISPKKWTLTVNVTDAARIPIVHSILIELGLAQPGAPPYSLTVQASQ